VVTIIYSNNKSLSRDEISLIRSTYLQEGTIDRTADILPFGRSTIVKYVGDLTAKTTKSKRYPGRKICKLNLETGEVIFVYPSIKHASKMNGIPIKDIRNCIDGKTSFAGRFGWRRKEE